MLDPNDNPTVAIHERIHEAAHNRLYDSAAKHGLRGLRADYDGKHFFVTVELCVELRDPDETPDTIINHLADQAELAYRSILYA